MKGLQLNLFEAILCALVVLLVTVSRQGLIGALAVEPRQSSDDDVTDSRLRIGAFNIQVFGVSKVQKDDVRRVLVNVSLAIIL